MVLAAWLPTSSTTSFFKKLESSKFYIWALISNKLALNCGIGIVLKACCEFVNLRDVIFSIVFQNFSHISSLVKKFALKGMYQTQIPTLPTFFSNLPAFSKNEISSWNFENLNTKVLFYGTNFFELKKKQFPRRSFFWNFKTLVPYKRTLVSFI